jgi:hypothetical protein
VHCDVSYHLFFGVTSSSSPLYATNKEIGKTNTLYSEMRATMTEFFLQPGKWRASEHEDTIFQEVCQERLLRENSLFKRIFLLCMVQHMLLDPMTGDERGWKNILKNSLIHNKTAILQTVSPATYAAGWRWSLVPFSGRRWSPHGKT